MVGGDSELFNRIIEDPDDCFGREYARSSPECKSCRAPVITSDGELHLLWELCAARTAGAETPNHLKKLTSQQVLAYIQRGASLEEVFEIILAGNDPRTMGTLARRVLANRLNYLRAKHEVPVPKCPLARDLVAGVQNRRST